MVELSWVRKCKAGVSIRESKRSGWIMSPKSSTFNLLTGIIADSVLTEGGRSHFSRFAFEFELANVCLKKDLALLSQR